MRLPHEPQADTIHRRSLPRKSQALHLLYTGTTGQFAAAFGPRW